MGKIHDRFKNGLASKNSRTGLRAHYVAPKNQSLGSQLTNNDTGVTIQSTSSSRSELDDYEIRNAFSKQKYIIAAHPDLGDVALVFPNFLVHADMARAVFRRTEIVAAGFFEIYPDNKVRVYGRSESLNKDNRGQADVAAIQRSLGLT